MYDAFVFDQLSLAVQITLAHLRLLQLYGNNLYVANILLGISGTSSRELGYHTISSDGRGGTSSFT
jgi:hypothetical protein